MVQSRQVVPDKEAGSFAVVDVVFDGNVRFVFPEYYDPRKEVVQTVQESVGYVVFTFLELLLQSFLGHNVIFPSAPASK